MPGMVMQMPGRHVSFCHPFLLDQIIQTPSQYNSSSVRYIHTQPKRALLFPNANSSGVFHVTLHHERNPFLRNRGSWSRSQPQKHNSCPVPAAAFRLDWSTVDSSITSELQINIINSAGQDAPTKPKVSQTDHTPISDKPHEINTLHLSILGLWVFTAWFDPNGQHFRKKRPGHKILRNTCRLQVQIIQWDFLSTQQAKLIWRSWRGMTKYAANASQECVLYQPWQCAHAPSELLQFDTLPCTDRKHTVNLGCRAVWTRTHLFLAGGAGCGGGRRARTQSLLYVQIQLVQFPHQLAHWFWPGRLVSGISRSIKIREERPVISQWAIELISACYYFVGLVLMKLSVLVCDLSFLAQLFSLDYLHFYDTNLNVSFLF